MDNLPFLRLQGSSQDTEEGGFFPDPLFPTKATFCPLLVVKSIPLNKT